MRNKIASKEFIENETAKLKETWKYPSDFYSLMIERMSHHSFTEEEVQYDVYVATEDPNRDYLRIAHIIQPVLDRRKNN